MGAARGSWGTDREGRIEDLSMRVVPLPQLEEPRATAMRYWLTENYGATFDVKSDEKMYGVRAHGLVPLRANGESSVKFAGLRFLSRPSCCSGLSPVCSRSLTGIRYEVRWTLVWLPG